MSLEPTKLPKVPVKWGGGGKKKKKVYQTFKVKFGVESVREGVKGPRFGVIAMTTVLRWCLEIPRNFPTLSMGSPLDRNAGVASVSRCARVVAMAAAVHGSQRACACRLEVTF